MCVFIYVCVCTYACLNNFTLLEIVQSSFYAISLINTSKVDLLSMLNFMSMASCTIVVTSKIQRIGGPTVLALRGRGRIAKWRAASATLGVSQQTTTTKM